MNYKLDDEGWNSELIIECWACEEECCPEVNIQITEDGRERAFTSCWTEGRIHVENHPEVKEMIKKLKENK